MSTAQVVKKQKSTPLHLKIILSILGAIGLSGAIFLGMMVIIYVGDKYTKEPPKNTFLNELTGNRYPLVSLSKACSFDGGCIDNVILFSANINAYSVEQFKKFVEQNPAIKTVCLRSRGGEVKELKLLEETIRTNGLSTCMADFYRRIAEPGGIDDNAIITGGRCSSSCNTALLSSPTRLQVGFATLFDGHATGVDKTFKFETIFDGLNMVFAYSVNKDSTAIKDTIKTANTPDMKKHLEYVAEVENINHFDDMKTLTPSELLKYRIFTHQCNGQGNCTAINTQSEK